MCLQYPKLIPRQQLFWKKLQCPVDGNDFRTYKRGMENYADIWNRNRVHYLYELARCDSISPAAVRVGLLFATFLQAEDREQVKPSYTWICQKAFMSRTTLSKALKELKASGLLRVETFHREASYYSMPFDGNSVWSISIESRK